MHERKLYEVKTKALLAKSKMKFFLEEENQRISRFMEDTVKSFTDESSKYSDREEAK